MQYSVALLISIIEIFVKILMEKPSMKVNGKGRFIAIEGLDGSGKSTQISLLIERLNSNGIATILSREPTDGHVGVLIGKYLSKEISFCEEVVAPLFAADRLDHLLNPKDGILSVIERGFTAITDRYVFSSFAYNGILLPLEWLIQLNSLSTKILIPNLIIFIDVDPEECINRIVARGRKKEKYEQLNVLKQARAGFFKSFELLKHEYPLVIVDGNQTPTIISDEIWSKVSKLYDE